MLRRRGTYTVNADPEDRPKTSLPILVKRHGMQFAVINLFT